MIDPNKPIFTLERTVQEHEIDDLNHVNNVVYVTWANEIAVSHWTTTAAQELLDTYGWFMIKHCIEYKKEAFLGDKILIKTQTGRATNIRYERFIEMYNKTTMELLAKTASDWCCIDKQGKPVRISEELRAIFETS
jgi:acyl-CoA thioester hydrolase